MAFDFGKMANKVTDKMTKLGQEASTMTKNVTENVKINSAISEQKKIVEAMYNVIGRKYYEQYSNNPEAEFMAEVSNISAAMKKIAELERKLSEVKGACPNCGAKITHGAAFCTNCGTKLSSNNIQPIKPQPQNTVTEPMQQPQPQVVSEQSIEASEAAESQSTKTSSEWNSGVDSQGNSIPSQPFEWKSSSK